MAGSVAVGKDGGVRVVGTAVGDNLSVLVGSGRVAELVGVIEGCGKVATIVVPAVGGTVAAGGAGAQKDSNALPSASKITRAIPPEKVGFTNLFPLPTNSLIVSVRLGVLRDTHEINQNLVAAQIGQHLRELAGFVADDDHFCLFDNLIQT